MRMRNMWLRRGISNLFRNTLKWNITFHEGICIFLSFVSFLLLVVAVMLLMSLISTAHGTGYSKSNKLCQTFSVRWFSDPTHKLWMRCTCLRGGSGRKTGSLYLKCDSLTSSRPEQLPRKFPVFSIWPSGAGCSKRTAWDCLLLDLNTNTELTNEERRHKQADRTDRPGRKR